MKFKTIFALILLLFFCVSCGEKPADALPECVSEPESETSSEAEEKPTALRFIGWPDYVTEGAVYAFEDKHPEIRIEVASVKSPEEMTALVESGEADLLVGWDVEELFKLSVDGMLRPLNDLIDTSILLSSVRRAGTVGGELTVAASRVRLEGFRLPADLMGGRTHFESVLALDDALSAAGDMISFEDCIRESLLERFSAVAYKEYVDWEARTCDFENENFIRMLELCSRAPTNDEYYEAYQEGKNDPLPTVFWTCQGILPPECEKFYALRDDVTPAASVFPAPGTGKCTGLGLSAEGLIAVPETCAHEDEVKAFLKFLYSREAQENIFAEACMEFSPVEALFSASLAEHIKPETPVPVWEGEKTIAELYPDLTDADLERWRTSVSAVVASADHYEDNFGMEGMMQKIIREKAVPFFEGSITAAEAAKEIQIAVSGYYFG